MENDNPSNPSSKKEELPDQAPPLSNPKLALQTILEKEVGLVKLFDYITQESFDLTFQQQSLPNYTYPLIEPLLGINNLNEVIGDQELDAGRLFLQEEYLGLKIKEKSSQILQTAENICREQGMKEPIYKRINRQYLIGMTLFMFLFFGIMYTPIGNYLQYVMIPIFLVFCLLPYYLRKVIVSKWGIFKKQWIPELINREKSNIEDLRVFIQELLDDVRERMLTNKIALQLVSFTLYSKDYKNIKLISEGNLRGSTTYTIQFTYPEGMEPFSTDQSMSQTILAEDDENDQFIILKNIRFNEEGALIDFTQSFLKKDESSVIEDLLSKSKFTPIDQPELIIPFIKDNTRILCSCNESIVIKDLKYCTWETDPQFEYYLAIGKKCSCKKNPFILFISPGVKEIPSKFKNIF